MRAVLAGGWGGRFVEPSFADLGKAWYFPWPLALAAGLHALGASGRAVVARSWLLTLGILAAIGIQQHFTGWPRGQVIPSSPQYWHATLFLGHHLSVASVLIFPFFAALELWRVRSGVLPDGFWPRSRGSRS